jgi:uncharacterized protein YjbI with pentapeptide repeats
VPTRDLGGGRRIILPTVEELTPSNISDELDEGTIDSALLSDLDLAGTKLGPLTLSNVILRQVDLSNASWQQVVARRTEWRSCRAVGVRLSLDLATDLSILDSKLDYATLHLEKVKGIAAFTGCSFREATISGDLSNTVFQDCDFTGTEFRARTASKCDLRSSRLTEARGLLTLKGATISMDQAVAISGVIAAEAGLIVAG